MTDLETALVAAPASVLRNGPLGALCGLTLCGLARGRAASSRSFDRVAPTGMIFVPCEGGISHNEIENAQPDDLAAGCQVLLQAMTEKAGAR